MTTMASALVRSASKVRATRASSVSPKKVISGLSTPWHDGGESSLAFSAAAEGGVGSDDPVLHRLTLRGRLIPFASSPIVPAFLLFPHPVLPFTCVRHRGTSPFSTSALTPASSRGTFPPQARQEKWDGDPCA